MKDLDTQFTTGRPISPEVFFPKNFGDIRPFGDKGTKIKKLIKNEKPNRRSK